MKQLMIAAAFVAAMFFGDNAQAQARRTLGVRHAQYNQHQRIQQGVRSGQLTRREATSLRMRQARIAGMKKMAKSDGIVTPRERMMLRRAQRNNSIAIYHNKHNRMHR